MKRLRIIISLLGLFYISAPNNATAQSERVAFKQAWKALGRTDWAAANQHSQSLQNYLLLPYIKAEQMRQRPDAFPNQTIEDYLQRYADWSFAPALRTSWLRWLGRSGQYDGLLQKSNSDDNDTLVRCYVAHSQQTLHGNDNSRKAALMQSIQALWLAPRSLPKQCDPAFAWLRKNGGISPALAWQRVGLAMQSRETALARYLNRFLSAADQQWLQRWLQMSSQRQSTLLSARQWPDTARAWEIAAWGLEQQARADAEAALQHWQMLDQRFSWTDAVRMPVLHSIGVFHALDLDPQALQTIDRLPSAFQDEQILAWRSRVALANGLWQEVLNSIQRMPQDAQDDERWRYWRARALRASGQSAAGTTIFSELASEATYYGFLAADWLGQDYQICPGPPVPLLDTQQWPSQLQLERALELFAVDLESHAARTWRTAMRGLSEQQRLQAARLAADAGWLQQAIFTANDAGYRNQYELRFPLAYQTQLTQSIQNRGLDSALVHGLIRAESAWHPRAISGAGARGLMQVTPATARRIAGGHGLTYRGSASLLEPDTNIAFGTANLARLSAQFGDDPIAVLAAYNAGPQVQQRWQNTRPPNPPDIWIETLSYFETRDYIPRVLAFSIIYDWRLSASVTPLAARMPGMQQEMGITAAQRAVNCAVTDTSLSTG